MAGDSAGAAGDGAGHRGTLPYDEDKGGARVRTHPFCFGRQGDTTLLSYRGQEKALGIIADHGMSGIQVCAYVLL